MEMWQVFLLGMMVAWTPSLIVLACAVWNAPLLEEGAGISSPRHATRARGFNPLT
jgi:hypothetical protein